MTETSQIVANRLAAERKSPGALGILLRIAMPIVLLAIGGVAYSYLSVEPEQEKAPKAEARAIRTRIQELQIADYTVEIQTNGVVQAHNEVGLSAEVGGIIRTISPKFEVGAYFEAGDVLVELDARDYETALAVAKANKHSAEAALVLAKQVHERNEQLAKRSVASVTKAAEQQSYASQLQAARQLDAAESAVEQAARDLERTKIHAPFSGRVRARSVGLGQLVGAGAPLGIVFSVEIAEIRLPISGREIEYLDLPELASDEPVAVEFRDGIQESNLTRWQGKIVRTEGVLDENSLELFAIARVEDPFGRKSGEPPLRIGQPVIGVIEGKTLRDVVAFPRAAVRQLDQVYLVDRESLTLSKKTIEPLWADEENMIVRDPLIKDGQWLATTSIVYAPEGAKIEIIPDIPDVEVASTETKETVSTK